MRSFHSVGWPTVSHSFTATRYVIHFRNFNALIIVRDLDGNQRIKYKLLENVVMVMIYQIIIYTTIFIITMSFLYIPS